MLLMIYANVPSVAYTSCVFQSHQRGERGKHGRQRLRNTKKGRVVCKGQNNRTSLAKEENKQMSTKKAKIQTHEASKRKLNLKKIK